MTHSTLTTLGSRALQLATLFLVAAPVSFGGEPVASDRDTQLIGHMVVSATREVPFLGSIVVTAPRSAVVLVADLGSMTVSAERDDVLVADLGSMTVTAERANVVVADLGAMTVTGVRPVSLARNAESQDARLSIRIPELVAVPFIESRGKSAKSPATPRVRP